MLIASALLLFYNYDFILGAFPVYLAERGGSSSEIGLLMGAFSGASFLARPLLAHLANRRGLGLIVRLAAVGGIVGPLAYLVTTSTGWLALLRVVHALMPAGFIMAIPLMLVDRCSPSERGRTIGLHGAATSSSLLVAPSIGITLLHIGGMRLVVAGAILAALGALFLLRSVRDLPEDRLPIGSDDRTARSLMREGTASEASGAADAEGRTASPWRDRDVLVILLVNLTVTLNFGMIFTFAAVHGTTLGVANPGLFFSAFALGSMSLRLLSGQAIDRFGARLVGAPGFLLLLAGLLTLATGTTPLTFFGGALLMGVGHGTCQTLLWTQLVERATQSRAMAAAGMTNAFDIGIILGSTVGGFIAEAFGFTWMYAAGALVLFVSSAVWLSTAHRGKADAGTTQASA